MGLPQFLGFGLQLVGVHGIDIQGLDSDGQGDPLLLFKLLLGLGHFLASVLYTTTHATATNGLATLARGCLFLFLCLHHFLPLGLGFLQAFLLFLSLFGLLFGFLFLLGSQFLFLFGTDFFAFGLLLL